MQKNVLILAGILIIAFAAMVAPVMAATKCYNFRKSPVVDESHGHRYHYRVEFRSISISAINKFNSRNHDREIE